MSKEQFDGNYKKTINNHNVILLTVAGSELLGLSTGRSDRDEMGIFLESPAELIGLQPIEDDKYRTAEDRTGRTDAPSEDGDIDLILYGLRKYVKLALGGNPNLLNMLYAPIGMCKVTTVIGEQLQMLRTKIVSKRAGRAFLGYLQAQKGRLIGSQGQKRVNRDDLVSMYGYDTKYAMHMLRLGLQGLNLLTDGKLVLPMSESNVKFLTKVRRGEHSLNQCIEYANHYIERIEEGLETPAWDALPEKPDYAAVEEWLLGVYVDSWGHK